MAVVLGFRRARSPSSPPQLADQPTAPAITQSGNSARRHLLLRLLRNRTALAGLIIVAGFACLAVAAPLVAPYDPLAANLRMRLQPPTPAHWFGTDELGRDILSRLLFGSRLSLGVAGLAALLIGSIALTVGTAAGYWGGVLDEVLMRIVDVLLGLPSLILTLALVGMLGAGLQSVVIGMVSVWWVGYSRLVRSLALSLRSRQYIDASKALGASDLRILVRHLIPNIVPVVIVVTTLQLGHLILAIAALSFLGLGAPPPNPEWGLMINQGRQFLESAPHVMMFPGLAISLTVLGFNLLGDGLRDTLDPTLRWR